MIKIGNNDYYSESDLKKDHKVWPSIQGLAKNQRPVYEIIMQWVKDKVTHPEPPVDTIQKFIEAAKNAVAAKEKNERENEKQPKKLTSEKEKGKSGRLSNDNQMESKSGSLKQEIEITPGLCIQSQFAVKVLEFEALLNEPTAKINVLNKQKSQLDNNTNNGKAEISNINSSISKIQNSFLKEKEELILQNLELLTGLICEGTYSDYLQGKRFLCTFEYKFLVGSKIARATGAFEKMVESQEQRLGVENREVELSMMMKELAMLNQVWPDFKEKFVDMLNSTKRGVHGASTTSGLANWPQKQATVGELSICLPLLMELTPIAQGHFKLGLYKWNIEKLIEKILQQTVRRFKLQTMCNVIKGIDAITGKLISLKDGKRILAGAFESIHNSLTKLVGGAVSGKAKEQLRQLTSLLEILGAYEGFTCTGYETPSETSSPEQQAPADMIFTDNDGNVIMIEVESVKEAEKAYTYLKDRYQHKLKTLGEGKFYIYIAPDLVKEIPEQQLKLITNDSELPILLLNRQF